jgi:hypothetical protein
MDDSRFDTWTRRRFGLATTGAVAAALGLFAVDDAEAKRKKRKRKKRKRCIELTKPCHVGGRKCCHNHECKTFNAGASGTFFCCSGAGNPCSSGEPCCPGLGCLTEVGSDVGVCVTI